MENLITWTINLRRDLHSEPELAFREEKTSKKIADILRSLGLEVKTGFAGTGVAGLLRGESPGKTLALRSDMDALPLHEKNYSGYKSKIPGIMHACGHDAHMSILLGTARFMVENNFRKKIKGNVKFIFQPGEEGGKDLDSIERTGLPDSGKFDTGAGIIIEQGVLKNPPVDMAFACHVSNELACGEAGLYVGAASASADRIKVFIRGKSSHAANPDKGSDAIIAASHFVTQLQTIVSRNVDPTDAAVISIGSIKGGASGNIIPEEVLLEGTARALNAEVRKVIKKRLSDFACSLKKSFSLEEVDYKYREGCPPCVNDPAALEILKPAAERAVGAANVKILEPDMLAEDFAYFARQVPAALFKLGTGNREKGITHDLHSPYFDIDEDALITGLHIMVKIAETYFKV